MNDIITAFDAFVASMRRKEPSWNVPSVFYDTLVMVFAAGASYGAERIAKVMNLPVTGNDWLDPEAAIKAMKDDA